MFRFRDPINADLFQNYPKKIDANECVKERFKERRMFYQAMKSYCKKSPFEIMKLLYNCIAIKDLKELKDSDFWFYHLNLNNHYTYRGRRYEMRYIIAELIELYTDILIKHYGGCEDYTDNCCQLGM